MDIFSYEKDLTGNIWPLCGVDEAGRGPLAGPVCAAAVILPESCVIEGLDDSKKLTPKRREALYERITAEALSFGIAFASVEEVGEAPVAAKLGTLLDGTNPTVATYIKDDGNLIRITAKASDEETALEMIRPVIDACKKAVGEQYIQSVCREEKAWNM